MALNDERIKQLADSLSASIDAYKGGLRINDSVTFDEANSVNFGRKMCEILKEARPLETKVIAAENRFDGGDQ